MELTDLRRWEEGYRLKAACLRQPGRPQVLAPQIRAANARFAATSPEEFGTFLAAFNRNSRSISRAMALFQQLQEAIAREEEIAAPSQEFSDLLAQDLLLWERLRQELRDHCASPARVEVIGYGEITTSLVLAGRAVLDEGLDVQAYNPAWVFKGLPPFPDADELTRYAVAFEQYSDLLQKAGLVIPEQRLSRPRKDADGFKVYVVQRRLDAARIGNVLIRSLDAPAGQGLVAQIARTLGRAFAASASGALGAGVRVGIDGQISNWYVPERADRPLLYLDTSTPLFRVGGAEQINPEIFLKNTPAFMRAAIRRFFLQDVLDRYYDFRRVLIDMVANLYKEGRADLVAPAVGTINGLLADELRDSDIAPLTVKEVAAYYREDAFIWRFFQAARRADRFVTERILGKKYPFRLPGKIAR
ncbi:MAG: DUF6206 family protein [Anaerolineae bacterium]|nr:DUF6206 family protein [Anaerolineae bacterium]